MNILAEFLRIWVDSSAGDRLEGRLLPFGDDYRFAIEYGDTEVIELTFEAATLRRFLAVGEELLTSAEQEATREARTGTPPGPGRACGDSTS